MSTDFIDFTHPENKLKYGHIIDTDKIRMMII